LRSLQKRQQHFLETLYSAYLIYYVLCFINLLTASIKTCETGRKNPFTIVIILGRGFFKKYGTCAASQQA